MKKPGLFLEAETELLGSGGGGGGVSKEQASVRESSQRDSSD